RVHTPVILKIAGEIGPLLADEPDGVDRSGVRIAEQHGGDRIAASVRVGSSGNAGFGVAECGAAGNALASEAVVVAELVLAAEFQRVAALDPGEVVIEGINGVLRAIIGAAAPGRIPV